MKKLHKPFIKVDKLGRICNIYLEQETPDSFKPTLNMFKGRQFQTNRKDCIDYLKLSLAAQENDTQAIKQLEEIHKSWNN